MTSDACMLLTMGGGGVNGGTAAVGNGGCLHMQRDVPTGPSAGEISGSG